MSVTDKTASPTDHLVELMEVRGLKHKDPVDIFGTSGIVYVGDQARPPFPISIDRRVHLRRLTRPGAQGFIESWA
jgi:hypothetical protein